MRSRTKFAVAALAMALAVPTFAAAGPDHKRAKPTRPGGTIHIGGEDLTPNGMRSLVLRRAGAEAVELGKMLSDDDGGFTVTFRVPDTLPAGYYQLAAVRKDSAAVQEEVAGPPQQEGAAPRVQAGGAGPGAPYLRPMGETAGLSLLVAVSALGGAGLLRASRPGVRRRP